MTDPTPSVTPIAFEVEARTRVKWPSQGLGDTRSCGLHVISPLHTTFLPPPHRSALTTPDPTPWTSLYRIEYSHENPSRNTPQWPRATWPLLKITWASRDDHITMCHLTSRSLSRWPWDLRVPTLFFFDLFLSYGVAGMHICQLAHLECTYILSLLAGLLLVGMHICQLAHLERPYILSLLAGPLVVVAHICRLACMEHAYI